MRCDGRRCIQLGDAISMLSCSSPGTGRHPFVPANELVFSVAFEWVGPACVLSSVVLPVDGSPGPLQNGEAILPFHLVPPLPQDPLQLWPRPESHQPF